MTGSIWTTYEELRAYVVNDGGGAAGATLIWQVLIDEASELGLEVEPPGSYAHCSEKCISQRSLRRLTRRSIRGLRHKGLGNKSYNRLRRFLTDTFGPMEEGV